MFTIGLHPFILRKTFARNAKPVSKNVNMQDIDLVTGKAEQAPAENNERDKEQAHANVIQPLIKEVNALVSGLEIQEFVESATSGNNENIGELAHEDVLKPLIEEDTANVSGLDTQNVIETATSGNSERIEELESPVPKPFIEEANIHESGGQPIDSQDDILNVKCSNKLVRTVLPSVQVEEQPATDAIKPHTQDISGGDIRKHCEEFLAICNEQDVIKAVLEEVDILVSNGQIGSGLHIAKNATNSCEKLDVSDKGIVEVHTSTDVIQVTEGVTAQVSLDNQDVIEKEKYTAMQVNAATNESIEEQAIIKDVFEVVNNQVHVAQVAENQGNGHIDTHQPVVHITGGFNNAHHLAFENVIMNDFTKIKTQNIYNQHKDDPPLSPIRTTVPCTSRNFVGQQLYLTKLHEYFSSLSTTERKIFLLYGMGGIGKTQICLKFIDDTADDFSHDFWIDATSEDTVVQSLRDAFKEISPPGTLATSFSAQATLRGISKLTSHWLIIYDNADGAPELIEKFLPPGIKGNIIITSRNPAHRRLASPESTLEVLEMGNQSSIDLILKASCSDIHDKNNRGIAQLVVNELNHHPLALDMAGAYILQTQCLLKDFLGIYKKYRPKILDNESFQGASTYNKTVYKTWELSFESLSKVAGDPKNKKADAAKYATTLINLSAFLHHDNLSYVIFERAAKYYDENKYNIEDIPTYLTIMDKSVLNMNENKEWNDHLFYESISLLLSFSLIKKTMNSKMYSIHPLVQTYCQDRLSVEEKNVWPLNASAVIASSVSESSSDKYIYQNSLLPHLLKNLEHKNKIGVQYYDDLHKISAKMLHNTGMYAIEEKYRLEIVNVHLGNNFKTNCDIASNLEKMQNSYLESDDSTTIYKRLESAIECVVDLTDCYCDQSKWADAEQLQTMLLSTWERILGKEHPKTLRVKNSLTNTYRNQGKLSVAEKIQINLLSEWERVLGEQHSMSLSEMNDFASAYRNQGRLTDAEEMQNIVQERILGKVDLATVTLHSNLAKTYHNQGKLSDAEKLHVEVLSLRERHHGVEHPETLRAMQNLANIYRSQGKWSDAEKLLTELVGIHERIFGVRHPKTYSVMNDLAQVYKDQGKFSDARSLQKKVYNMKTRDINDILIEDMLL